MFVRLTPHARIPVALFSSLALLIGLEACAPSVPTEVTTPAPAVSRRKAAKKSIGTEALNTKLNAGVKNAIKYETREQKVAVMTQAFSTSKNEGLVKAGESFSALGRSLAGLQGLVTGTRTATKAGPLVKETPGAAALYVSSNKNSYRLLASQEFREGDTVITYDEQTKELTSIRSPDTELKCEFTNQGNQRTWTAELIKSPDGTSGALAVEVYSETWKPYELPQPRAPWVCEPASPRPSKAPAPVASPNETPRPTPTPAQDPEATPTTPRPEPTPTANGEASTQYTLRRGNDDENSEAHELSDDNFYDETEDPYGYDDERPRCGPDPNWVAPLPPPFRVAAGEYPEHIESLNIRLNLLPRGDESLAFSFTAELSEPENVPNTNLRIPTRWQFIARIPGLTFDWESKLNLIPKTSTFEAKGKMLVEVPDGEEQFNYVLGFKEARRSSTFSMTNVGAKITLLMASDDGNRPVTRLISSEDNSDLGTIEMKPGHSNIALVRFNDGTSMEWELWPNNAPLPFISSAFATQPPDAPPVRPMAPRVPRPAIPERDDSDDLFDDAL